MDRFLLKRKSANEAEVEEVHVEENLAAPTTKRNNVRVFKFNEKWKDGRPGCRWRMERCSVLTAKCLTKQAETNSSQVVNRCAWRMSAHMKQAMLIKLATRRS